MDKLDEIFKLQEHLQEKLYPKSRWSRKNIIMDQSYINMQLLAVFDELCEAMRETSWKNNLNAKWGWKSKQLGIKSNFQGELADVLHFYINLCFAAGLTPERLYKLYIVKNAENIRRKKHGY